MFLGFDDVHLLVEAQKRRLPALLFQVVRDPRRTPPDAMFSFVARRSDARRIGGSIPNLGRVRENVSEPIQGMLDAREGFKGARGNIENPRIGGADIREDETVVNRLLVDQILRKFGARNCGHTASKTLSYQRTMSAEPFCNTLRLGVFLEAGDLFFLPHLASRAGC